ncbi:MULTISPECIES: M13 family metallopeptidase [unclassified Sphingopyxis]|uniref:M13 family metallopeptidase n=1 Tax=unclassified Sphingopyxis TaxID=2614943 RepID=UPI001E392DE3|nr:MULTISPECIES: M13 family metallopeptidase [unclassified Sphingopyxis]
MDELAEGKMSNAKVVLLAIALIGSNASVAQAEGNPEAPVTYSPSSKSSIGNFGFDTAGMNQEIQPGDDFYSYANGTWSEVTEIPAHRSNYGIFTELGDTAKKRVGAILENAKGDSTSAIGRAYSSFLDDAAIEARGLAPIDSWLNKVRAVDKAGLPALLAEADRNGVQHFFSGFVAPDELQPGQYIYTVMQHGTGASNRDIYSGRGESAAASRASYIRHLETILTLIGESDATSRAETLYAFEEQLATLHPSAGNSPLKALTVEELKEISPDFDWDVYLRAVGVHGQSVLVLHPNLIADEAKFISDAPIGVLRDLLLVRSVDCFATVLPKVVADESARYFGGPPSVSYEQRRERAAEFTTKILPDAVSRQYIALYYSADTAAAVDQLAADIREATARRIQALSWMEPKTKAKALRKLAAMRFKLGYPTHWKDYSSLEIRSDDAFGNALRSNQFAHDDEMVRLAGPIRDWEWGLSPIEVNGYAAYNRNEIVITAAILQPPFFDRHADPAVNYGAIGAAIASQISRHFDDFGAGYDESGRSVNWWTKNDHDAFRRASAPLIAQYGAYEVLPGLRIDGRSTLAENIADLAGLTIAYDAYRKSLGGGEAPVIDGLTGDQRFFLGWAQVWRRNYREQNLAQRITTDPHSPSIQRTWVSRNLDPWYKAYNVKEGQKLYLAPKDRVRIW